MNGPLILAVTRRCALEDLEFAADDLDRPLEELASRHPMVAAFVSRRSASPIGQETIQGLTSHIVAYSLHSGEDRGATWHQELAGVVWLLAARFHRSGAPDDAYPYFGRLDAQGRLLPTREDLEALTRRQVPTLARSLLTDVPRLLRDADASPGTVITALIGGRIPIALVREAGDRPMLTVAISTRIHPGQMPLPADWFMVVTAAFFPELRPTDLHVAFDLGGRPIPPGAVAFCNFKSLDR